MRMSIRTRMSKQKGEKYSFISFLTNMEKNTAIITSIPWRTLVQLIPHRGSGSESRLLANTLPTYHFCFEGGNINWHSSWERISKHYWQLWNTQFPSTWWVRDKLADLNFSPLWDRCLGFLETVMPQISFGTDWSACVVITVDAL